jgi:hypothetical protein
VGPFIFVRVLIKFTVWENAFTDTGGLQQLICIYSILISMGNTFVVLENAQIVVYQLFTNIGQLNCSIA